MPCSKIGMQGKKVIMVDCLTVCKESWMENRRSRNRKMGQSCGVKGLPRCLHQAAPHLITRVRAGQQTKPIFLTISHGSYLPLVTMWDNRVLSLTSRAASGWKQGLSFMALLCQCLFRQLTPASSHHFLKQTLIIWIKNSYLKIPCLTTPPTQKKKECIAISHL